MHAALVVTLLAAIDLSNANRAFSEMDAMCAADAGRLWGRSLCGPMVFADASTRDAATREGAAKIPDSIGIANTAVEWNGKTWTMVMWPLPQNTIARRALLAHESFHRLQKDLGLPMSSPRNAHLDSADARASMRLEWRALARALATRDPHAVSEALAFRAQRHNEEERLLEMNEGLAEYTGYALAVPHVSERIAPLVRKLANAEKSETYARSFAYASGPAWGTLIEMKDPHWTRKVKPSDDLGAIARKLWGVSPSMNEEAYGAAAVRADEQARAEKKEKLLASLRAKFVDGPVLTIPLRQMQFTFDPNNVQPLGDLGTVYPSMEVRDVWGKIVVTGGGLISPDYQRLVVPASGEGYTLTLNEGWKIVPGVREGDTTLRE
ncbi:MAG TPA: hypothetical protein VJZ00_22085 [Thermoanaerobaculia bacterium]|nr:hypothetical protein [Thermoanaerobaculia bacterium]